MVSGHWSVVSMFCLKKCLLCNVELCFLCLSNPHITITIPITIITIIMIIAITLMIMMKDEKCDLSSFL